MKKRFSKFQSRTFSKRLGRDVASAAEVETPSDSTRNILGGEYTASPLESVSNSQDVNRSSYRLRRNSELNKANSADNTNTTNDNEKYEKKVNLYI